MNRTLGFLTTTMATSLTAVTALLAGTGSAQAVEVTITATMKNVGEGAYAAVYLTDSQGAYQGSLWLSGGKAKYYQHLPDWFQATGGAATEYDGITGASIGSGRTLQVTVDLAGALIDAGYQIRIDTSVEDGRDIAKDIAVDLTTAGAGQTTAGRGYIKSFSYGL